MKAKILLAMVTLAALATIGQRLLRHQAVAAKPALTAKAIVQPQFALPEAPVDAVPLAIASLEGLPHAPESALATVPLRPGSMAPDFVLPDQNGKMRRLSETRGKKVVLSFYPQDFTYSCVGQAVGFTRAQPELLARDAVVFGVSVQPVASKKRFASRFGISYPLLADSDRRVARQYRVLSENGNAARVTFIIDADGRIASTDQNVHAQTHARDVLAILDSLAPRAAREPFLNREASGGAQSKSTPLFGRTFPAHPNLMYPHQRP